MKKYFLLLFITLTPFLNYSQNTTPSKKDSIAITIKIEPEKENSVWIRGYYNLWGEQENIIQKDKNSISITKAVTHNELLIVYPKNLEGPFTFYLEKGDRLTLAEKNKKLIIEGDSRAAKQNRLLQNLGPIRNGILRYYSEVANYERKTKNGVPAKKPADVDINGLYQKMEDMVAEFKSATTDISASFIQFIEMDTKYFRIKNELQMPTYLVKTYHPFSQQDIAKLEECLQDSHNEDAVLSLYYRQVLSSYMDYLRINDPKKLLGDGKDWIGNEVKIANYIPNLAIRQYIVANNLFAIHYENGKNPEYIETVSKQAGQWASFINKAAQGVKGKSTSKQYDRPAEYPQLRGIDVAGKKVSLNDLKGQWIYVDIWATWCGPCKFEIPYLQELEHRLKEYNIAFVSISIDKEEDRSKLLDLIKKENLGGIQIQNSNVEEVYSQLAVMGIPHFAIIAPDGKLFLNKAPKPSTGIPDRLLKSLASPK